MIPNIVKGTGVTGGIRYALGEGNDRDTGERKSLPPGEQGRAEILGGQNFGFDVDTPERLELARRMMEWNGAPENQASRARKCVKDCLHASLSWEKGQAPTAADMIEAAQGFLAALGMEGSQAVFIAHNDTEHPHMHIIASRLDPATGKTYDQQDDFAKAQAWSLRYEREHGQQPANESRRNLHAIVDAIRDRDATGIIDNLTQRSPTFTARELDKALAYGELSPTDRASFREQILSHRDVIELRDGSDSKTARYTSRDVLASEVALLETTASLAANQRFGVSDTRRAATAEQHTLKPEQSAALDHLTQDAGFAILWGQAGTGKSHTLAAVRSAYEAEGFTVWGLSWTNDVVQQMAGDGFAKTATIASALGSIDKGQKPWDRNTVLVVDEAAMLATKHLSALATAAQKAGAKLILAGDDAQLSSIERGGMFETLRRTHGAAELNEVQRVKGDAEKAAFNQMHEGKFRAALDQFDKSGSIHWSEKQSNALRNMAAKYAADAKGAPEKRRFMFAHTNAEVDILNQQARALHAKRGDLKADHVLPTANGPQKFAAGDRVQFTGNGYGHKQKKDGLTNGRVGTITAIEAHQGKQRVTVSLDVGKTAQPKSVSFVVGDNAKAGEFNNLKLGYAGTIYKGQGKTLDQAYVCHSGGWRSAAAYVALTRHRERVEIFASRQTVQEMDSRDTFKQGADVTTKTANARALDIMAAGMARRDTRRAASAYEPTPRGAVKLDYGVEAHKAVTQGKPLTPAQLAALSPKERAGVFAALTVKLQQHRDAIAQLPDAGRTRPGAQSGGTAQPMTRRDREERNERDVIAAMQARKARGPRSGRGR